MKHLKYLLITLGIFAALTGCSSQEKNPPLPLAEAAKMPEEQIAEALHGITRDELAEAWGEPAMELFGMDGEVYPFESEDGKGHLTVYYGNENRSVVSVKRIEETKEAISLAPADDLEQLTADAILTANQGKYPGEECVGEGHIILESRKDGDSLTLYALTMYGEYQFQDGNFVKAAGSGVVPAVITFSSDENGRYQFQSLAYPEDGSNCLPSIQAMFPESWWDECISPSETTCNQLKDMEMSYARKYLEDLGRNATIGEYKDFDHPLLTELGVNTNVSNILVENKVLDSYPYWTGNVERLEDGVRYVYALDFDREDRQIRFTKTEYDTGNIMESYIYDSDTGLLLSPDVILSQPDSDTEIFREPPVLTLQDVLSSTLNPFELKNDTASWNYRQETGGDEMVSFVSCGTHPLTAAKDMEPLKLPRYNRMDSVSYIVSSVSMPDRILVHEYNLPDFMSGEEMPDDLTPVSSKTYEGVYIIDIMPGKGYTITAEWDKEHLETRGYYGTGYYSFITQ